jgi:hypothetical protein
MQRDMQWEPLLAAQTCLPAMSAQPRVEQRVGYRYGEVRRLHCPALLYKAVALWAR